MRVIPLAAAVAALTPLAAADAADTRYISRTLTETAKPGLEVTGPLKDYRVTSRARVVVPLAWARRSAPAGQLRFRNQNNGSCAYDIAYVARSVVAASQDASAYAAAALPATSARYVLDSGARGNRAWRVVRRPSSGGRVRLAAIWAGVLTKRSDIAPSGKAAWTEIRVTAISRPGDECHSGTYRQALGPAIGDSLAVARTGLRFVRAGS
jgi:hypothetical protein